MRKVDHALVETRRDLILRAAGECFSKKGLHGATMQDISKAAGMRSGTVYYYFSSRDEIIETLFDRNSGDLVKRVSQMMEGDGDFAAAIFDIHNREEAARREWNIGPGLRLELIAEAARNDRLSDLRGKREQKLIAAVREAAGAAIATGKLNPSFGIDNFARTVMLFWEGIAIARVENESTVSLYKETIAKLLEPWLTPGAKSTTLRRRVAGRGNQAYTPTSK